MVGHLIMWNPRLLMATIFTGPTNMGQPNNWRATNIGPPTNVDDPILLWPKIMASINMLGAPKCQPNTVGRPNVSKPPKRL